MATTLQFRQMIAKEAGRFQTGTFKASGGDTTNAIDEGLLKSSISQDDLFSDYYLFIPSGTSGNKRRVVKTYTASTGNLLVDLAFSNASDWQSKAYELHGMIEPLTDMPDLINEALKRMFVVVEFTVTPTALQTRHSLASAAVWLTDPTWVRQVGYLVTGESREQVDPFSRTVRGQASIDGATVYLNHPRMSFNATDTIYVKALKPAYFHCKATAGSFGGQSGLSLEDDEAPVAADWLCWLALGIATRRERGWPGGDKQDDLRTRQTEFMTAFDQKTQENLTVPPLTFRMLRSFGRAWKGGW